MKPVAEASTQQFYVVVLLVFAVCTAPDPADFAS
jgi:hypothetical protein